MHTFKGKLERPVKLTVMFLDCRRKPKYPERTHTCTGRTSKLQAERLHTGIQTQDLLAARQQYYQLHHRAAQLLYYGLSKFIAAHTFVLVLFAPYASMLGFPQNINGMI
ncbi:hypothetical protein ATANTOWER_013129 [Ataeniobius toweri]|uniref:Uncharacterized protein n=1 Tax=Ataeniobius toweri TaxID=208326 RepID=A0ABU7CGB9_9TELE|nr:hypothetical protein [Ataeniobius toweri]